MSETKFKIPISGSKSLHATLFSIDNKSIKSPLVILCHGFTGDRKEWGRFPNMARILNQNGFDALTFDFAGSGENHREPVTLSQQVGDLLDVYSWTKIQQYTEISILGLSFGGLTLLYAELLDCVTHIFWAPAFYVYRDIKKYQKFQMKVASLLKITPIKIKSGSGKSNLIEKPFLTELMATKLTIDEKLTNLHIPTLILHGGDDNTVNPSYSADAFKVMPSDVNHKRIEIEGADHDFKEEHLEMFIEKSIEWLKAYHHPINRIN